MAPSYAAIFQQEILRQNTFAKMLHFIQAACSGSSILIQATMSVQCILLKIKACFDCFMQVSVINFCQPAMLVFWLVSFFGGLIKLLCIGEIFRKL